MPPRMEVASAFWPALPYAAWKDTCATLHLWTQIVGEIRLAQTPCLNHSGMSRFTSRGFANRPFSPVPCSEFGRSPVASASRSEAA